MFKKDKSARDAFTLGLGGVTAISTFAAAPAIAHDRLRQVQVDQVQVDREQQYSPYATLPSFGRYWLRRSGRSRAAC